MIIDFILLVRSFCVSILLYFTFTFFFFYAFVNENTLANNVLRSHTHIVFSIYQYVCACVYFDNCHSVTNGQYFNTRPSNHKTYLYVDTILISYRDNIYPSNIKQTTPLDGRPLRRQRRLIIEYRYYLFIIMPKTALTNKKCDFRITRSQPDGYIFSLYTTQLLY